MSMSSAVREAATSPNVRAGRRELWVLIGFVLAGLVLRLSLWKTQSLVSIDGTNYIRLAWALAGGSPHDTVQPPGYPILIVVFHWVVRDWVTAARAVDLAAGLALLPLVWLIARLYVARWWLRFLPVAAVAFLPLPVRLSLTTMSEAPYLAFLLGAFLALGHKRASIAGLLGGIAYLVRPEALLAIVLLALMNLRRRRQAALLMAGAALVVLLGVVAQGAATGVWTLSRKTVNIAASDWRENEMASQEGQAPATTAERVETYGKEAVSAYPKRLADLTAFTARHGGWVLPVMGLAAIASPAMPLAAGLPQILVTPLFAIGTYPRFIFPMLPFLWILAAVFLDRRGRAMRLALVVLGAAGLVASGVFESRAYRINEDGTFPELVEAGQWLAPHVQPGTVIYDRKPYAAFYAGATYRPIPLGDYDATLDAIVRDGGDFLVVDQAVVDYFRPALLPLALDKGVAGNEPRLRAVYVNLKYRDRHTIVYRVVRPGGPEPLPEEKSRRELLELVTHQENHFVHGILAMRGERWQVAAGEFAYAISADSTNATAFNNRAWCLLQAGLSLPSAESDARHAVALAPDNPDFLDTLIAVLRRVGKDEEADRLEPRLRELEARR